jgi:hypothetical protein
VEHELGGRPVALGKVGIGEEVPRGGMGVDFEARAGGPHHGERIDFAEIDQRIVDGVMHLNEHTLGPGVDSRRGPSAPLMGTAPRAPGRVAARTSAAPVPMEKPAKPTTPRRKPSAEWKRATVAI